MALQAIDAGDIDYILVHHDLHLAARSADRIQLVATTAGNVIVRRQVVFKSCQQQRTTFLPLLLGSDDLIRFVPEIFGPAVRLNKSYLTNSGGVA
jgi:ABC-type hemin transport system ATPase subunit